MKNYWKRFSQRALAGCLLGAMTTSNLGSMAWGQQRPGQQGPQGPYTPGQKVPGTGSQGTGSQATGNPTGNPNGNQSVAPPAAGYGNRPSTGAQTNNGNASSNGNPQPRQTQQQQGMQPNQQGAANGANPNLNPNLNPNFNQPLNPVPAGGQVPGGGTGKEIATADPYAAKPLSQQEIAYLDQVLNFWEKSTADITRYSCKFKRWKYNSNDNFVAQLSKDLKVDIRSVNTTVAAGEVKYMAPDKGMFKIDKLLSLSGQIANNRPEYKEFDNGFGEWWLCNGKEVYEYDRKNKQCTKHTLPPEMQGSAILDSPMPFVFGVKADKIKERYWVRSFTPTDATGKPNNDLVVIEAYPKFQSDAVNYDHVQIYLDRQAGLPAMLIKFDTEHQDEAGKVLSDKREIFEFTDREKNANLMQKISDVLFRKEFIPFDVPSDWKTIEIPYAPPAQEGFRAAGIPPAGLNPNIPPK